MVGKYGCVIMASGEGKRFGGNKLMAPLGGKPMILWVLKATEGVFASRIVVTRHEPVAALCREMNVQVCLHDLPLRSDTVRLGMEHLPDDLAGCMFCQADQPLVSRQTIRALCAAAEADARQSIWRAACAGVPGAPVLFPRWTFDALRHLPEGKGGGAVIRMHAEQVRSIEVADVHELMDIDTREDLSAMQAYLQNLK